MTLTEKNTSTLTLMDLLDSRENRARHQQELLEKYGGSLISMTLNIPGPVKDSPEYRKVLRRGMDTMKAGLNPASIVYEEIRELVTGPEGYLCINGTEPVGLKQVAVEAEESSPLGRLLDIDIITEEGSVSRSDLGHGPRKCLLCDNDAKICARSRAHSMDQLLEKVGEIIAKNL